MSQSVISDNWSLQDIARLFTSGLDESDTSYLIIERINDRYGYEPVSHAGVSSESLFDFLTDIILRDQIIVDEQFINTWKDLRSPLDLALKEKIDRKRSGSTFELSQAQHQMRYYWSSKGSLIQSALQHPSAKGWVKAVPLFFSERQAIA